MILKKFYNLYLSQTFGENDRREKLFNILKKNYKNSKFQTWHLQFFI